MTYQETQEFFETPYLKSGDKQEELVKTMMEECDPSEVEAAYLTFRRHQIAKARSSLKIDHLLVSQGLVDLDHRVNEWFEKFFSTLLDNWDEMSDQGSYLLETDGLPKSPSKLIPDDPNITEPGFIMMARILDALNRGITTSDRKTGANNPYKVLKQALGQEMVSMANFVVTTVEKLSHEGKVESERDIYPYKPLAAVDAAPETAEGKEEDFEFYKREQEKFERENPDKVKKIRRNR